MSIVVGTDGTGWGTAAVEWAAAEARRRRTPLRVVHAYDSDWPDTRYDIGNEFLDVGRALADAVVAAARDRALAVAPEIDLDIRTVAGPAARTLLAASSGADLLVLAGRAGIGGPAFGSVGRRIIARAACPVVVVRGRPGPDGPVVAGIDDSPSAELVLAAAFAAAAGRGCGLVVVRSCGRRDAEPGLAERMAPWRARFPGVPAGTVLTGDPAAAALLAGSHDAQLVVVGPHTRRPLHRSVGRRLLGRAGCPVLVAR